MILPDVNVLVYAFRVHAPEHARYLAWLEEVRLGEELALVESVMLGVVRVTTDSRFLDDPASVAEALAFVDALRLTPGARDVEATSATWECMRNLCRTDRLIRGRLVPDAWLAALAISHGARLATNDRGFARFPGLDWFVPVSPIG